MSDPIAEANAAAEQLLLLYEALGVVAIVAALTDNELTVRCQSAEDVVPICKKILKEHDAPEGRTLN